MTTQEAFSVAMAGKAMDISKMGGQLIQRTQQEMQEKAPPPALPPQVPPPEVSENHVDVYT
jgi:hypothetical protein